MLKQSLSAILVLGSMLVGCSNQHDGQNSLASDRSPRPTSLMKRIAKVDCVLAVEQERISSIEGGNLGTTGNLIITLKDDANSFLCSQKLVAQVKGLQLLSVMDAIGVVSAKGKATTAKLPRNLKEKLESVSCVQFVEEELEGGLNGESRTTGHFMVGFEDEFNASSCAEQIYKKIPGAQIDAQIGAMFHVLGK